MYNVLVLGATGFIGGHIAKKAQEVGWQVSGFRRNKESVGHLQKRKIQWIEGSLEDYPTLRAAMTGMDYVFHAAGYFPLSQNPAETEEHTQIAVNQIRNVIKACRESRIKRLIYTSSLTTIGLPPKNEDRLADERDIYLKGTLPDNGYYESKIAMENIALEAASVGYDIVVLNPTTVFGPGDIHLRTGKILVMVAEGKVKALPPGWINIIDVRDVAAAHINAARIGRIGQRYILGGLNYKISEAVRIIAELVGVKAPVFTLPIWCLDLFIWTADRLPFIPHPPFHLRAHKYWQGYNTNKARAELNLQTRFLEETVRDSIKWFSDQGVL